MSWEFFLQLFIFPKKFSGNSAARKNPFDTVGEMTYISIMVQNPFPTLRVEDSEVAKLWQVHRNICGGEELSAEGVNPELLPSAETIAEIRRCKAIPRSELTIPMERSSNG